jgi:hypothetical protein
MACTDIQFINVYIISDIILETYGVNPLITPITSQGVDPLFTNERWPVMEANAAKLAPVGKPKMVLPKIHAARDTNHR